MQVPRPSEREILDRIYNKIVNQIDISANLDSSIIGMILKIVAAEMDYVWGYIEELNKNSNLSTASGPALDNFGLLLGVPRRIAKNASTLGATRAVRFTNLGSGPVNIPTGTRVFKDKSPQIAFFTVEGTTLAAGSSVDLHASASSEGEVFNVGIGELTRHSIPNVTVNVTNILPIQNGSLSESDSSYRNRLLQEFTRRDVLNPSNVDALLRSVPGVKDVFLIDLKRGAGTFDAIIIPYNQSALSQIVEECQALLNENIPIGISALARGPQYRSLDLNVKLRFDPKATAERSTIRESIKAQIIARIDNLPIEDGSGNGSFFTTQLRALAINSSPLVLDAVVDLGLDGNYISSEGEISLGVGERLLLKSLGVS